MENIELYAIEREFAAVKQELADASLAYENFENIEGMHRGTDKHLVSENLNYKNFIAMTSVLLGASKPQHIEAFPETLDDLDQEGFKARVKEVKDTIWKAISEAFEKFVALMKRWYNKLKDLIVGKSDDTAKVVDSIEKMIERSDEIATKHGYKRGDVIPDDKLDMIEEADGVRIMVNHKNAVLMKEDFERDLSEALPTLKGRASLLKGLALDGKVTNIKANVDDCVKMMAELTKFEYLTDVVSYVRNMLNITTREELIRFLDDDTKLTLKALTKMVEDLKLEGSKVEKGSLFTSKEIIGGKSVRVSVNKSGNSFYPRASVIPSAKQASITTWPNMTLKTLIESTHGVSELANVVSEAARGHALLADEVEKRLGPKGKDIKESAQNIRKAATEREQNEVATIITEIKNINQFVEGWSSMAVATANMAKNIQQATEQVAAAVSEEYHNAFFKKGKK